MAVQRGTHELGQNVNVAKAAVDGVAYGDVDQPVVSAKRNRGFAALPGEGIERVLFGLDIGTAELLMAQQLGYDAVIAHHPVGVAFQSWRVFQRHVDLLQAAGVPEDAAREAVAPKLDVLRLSGQVRNYEQVPLAAERLGIGLRTLYEKLKRYDLG